MRSTRRAWLAAIAGSATASIAGCTGDGSGDDGDDSTDDESTGGGTDDTDGTDGTGDDGTDAGVTIETAEHPELGEILVDGDGMTLYMFDPDPHGEGSSACTGDCASAWPPLTSEDGAEAGSGVMASLSTFEREDGSTQVAANGWPLYYWQNDAEPGDATGQGVSGVWWVLRPDGTPVRPDVRVREHEQLGEILVDSEGRTLYMFDADEQGEGASNCSGGCADAWPPLTVEDGAMASGNVEAELTTFEREEGSTQVAAGGWPLYYWQNDDEPGDVLGQGVGGVWWVLRPDGTPVRPDVRVSEHEEYGEILVDTEGRTLYMFDADTQGSGESSCMDGCADAWPPLTVEEGAMTGMNVSADLTTFERSDGSTQVAVGGWPLYYFAQDAEPGDVNGQGVNDAWWVLRPDGTPVRPDVRVREHAEYGNILVDSEGMTLYMFDSDSQGSGASTCSGGCADAWPPLTVEKGALAGGSIEAELTTFEREDGSTQVAANGWPLYYYAQDTEPGDATGQGVSDVWWVLDPTGAPIRSTSSSSGSSGGSSDDSGY